MAQNNTTGKYSNQQYLARLTWVVCLEILVLIGIASFVFWDKLGHTSNDSDFELSFTPTYDSYIHPGYIGQEDNLPESPGGSCSVEVTLKNPRRDQYLSSIVLVVHDLVGDAASLLHGQALFVGPNIVLPGKEVSLGSVLIGLATRDQSIPYSLSFSYEVTWENMDANGMYVGTHIKKDFPRVTITLPPVRK